MNVKTKNQRIIVAPTMQELKDESYQRRLRMAVANLKIPSRRIPDHVSHAIFRPDILIINVDGERVDLCDVDSMIGDDRNLRNALRILPDGAFARGVRKLSLLYALTLWLKIEHPNIARHFGR